MEESLFAKGRCRLLNGQLDDCADPSGNSNTFEVGNPRLSEQPPGWIIFSREAHGLRCISQTVSFASLAEHPYTKGLARCKCLVQNETLKGARRGHGVAFGAVAELCRIRLGDIISASCF